MRKSPETAQPSRELEKPAKERMIEASQKVFLIEGIHATGKVAQQAHSNLDTFVRYFGRGDALVERFIDAQIAEAEAIWQGIATEHANHPEDQLRRWLAMADGTVEGEIGFLLRPEVVLSRTAAELPWHPKHALLIKIESYWQAERRRVLKLCRDARLRKPIEACDKLLLLVHGARSHRSAFGSLKPMRLVGEAGEDILAGHGCAGEPQVDPLAERDPSNDQN